MALGLQGDDGGLPGVRGDCDAMEDDARYTLAAGDGLDMRFEAFVVSLPTVHEPAITGGA